LNILTKICVVILLVLVLFASIVFTTMATVPQNWRGRYQQEQQRRLLSDQAVRFAKLLSARQAEELRDAEKRANDLATELADAKKDKVADPTQTMVAEFKLQLDTANARLAELQLNVEAMAKRNERLSEQLDEGRKTVAGLQKENRRSAGEITQLLGKVDRAVLVVAALQRQLNDRDERIKDLETQVVGGGTGKKAGPSAAAGLSGTIKRVKGELASINIGSAQGVVRGQKLLIYRNANFVGYLRIDDVDQGESAGTIVDKQLDPVAGDKVTSRDQLK